MKYGRFESDGLPAWGILDGDVIRKISAPPFGDFEKTPTIVQLKAARILAPCVPSKIIAIGLNYKDHISEFGRAEIPDEPVLFLKAPSSIVASDDAIVRPPEAERVDYEGEMAVVIRKKGRRIPASAAKNHVLGVTCLNDVTARSLQQKDRQWARSKSFDTFTPMGPWIADGLNYDDLAIETRLNGKMVQSSRTSEMIFSVSELVAFASNAMTLYPGDVISTGTPRGVGPIAHGDVVEISIEGVGVLRNTAIDEGRLA